MWRLSDILADDTNKQRYCEIKLQLCREAVIGLKSLGFRNVTLLSFKSDLDLPLLGRRVVLESCSVASMVDVDSGEFSRCQDQVAY